MAGGPRRAVVLSFFLPPSHSPHPRGFSPPRPMLRPRRAPGASLRPGCGEGRPAPAAEVTLQKGRAGRGAARAVALPTARGWGPGRDPAAAAERPPPTGSGLTWEPAAPRQPPARAQDEQHTQVPAHGRRAHAHCGPGRACGRAGREDPTDRPLGERS